MIRKEVYFKEIASSLAILTKEIELHNCVCFYDINHIAEDFYAKLLNLIYGYNLCNMNSFEKNAPAIDLSDKNNKLSIQVTSDNTSEKIKNTISKFIKHEQYHDYDRLIILILTKKKAYRSEFDTKNCFHFDKDRDIIDYTDLIKEINASDIESVKEISKFLYREFTAKNIQEKHSMASEVETIIDLIEYISTNRIIHKNEEGIIDPNYKINKRFVKYAEKINQDFIMLHSLYSKALEVVETELEIDQAQTIITGMYLRELSTNKLEEAMENPIHALEFLTDYFENQLGKNGKMYDRAAIKYFLLNELIKCNVFPNEGSALQ